MMSHCGPLRSLEYATTWFALRTTEVQISEDPRMPILSTFRLIHVFLPRQFTSRPHRSGKCVEDVDPLCLVVSRDQPLAICYQNEALLSKSLVSAVTGSVSKNATFHCLPNVNRETCLASLIKCVCVCLFLPLAGC